MMVDGVHYNKNCNCDICKRISDMSGGCETAKGQNNPMEKYLKDSANNKNVEVSTSILSVSIKEFEEMEKLGIQMDITNPIFKKALESVELDTARKIGEAAGQAGLVPKDLANPEDWKNALQTLEKEVRKDEREKVLEEFKVLRTKQEYYDEPLKAMSKVNEIIYKLEETK